MISEEPRIIFFHYWLDAVRLKASPKAFRKPYRPRLEHRQNLARACGKNVGFCYNGMLEFCNYFSPSKLKCFLDILRFTRPIQRSDKLTNFLYLMTEHF
jgi:hypothetical protein